MDLAEGRPRAKKLAYIIHPLTTGGVPSNENIMAIERICKLYATSLRFIPVSPYHLLQFVHTVDGDQLQAYMDASAVMLSCDEVHIWGPWISSTGCRNEVMLSELLGLDRQWLNLENYKEKLACH